MQVMIKGELAGVRHGENKDHKPYVYTSVLTGDEVVKIFGYDPGQVKRLSMVEVLCEVRNGEKGMFITPVKA